MGVCKPLCDLPAPPNVNLNYLQIFIRGRRNSSHWARSRSFVCGV